VPVPRDPTDGLGERVAARRAERGLRVSDLAKAIGVSASQISQIERGRSRPSVSTLFAIAEVLSVPVDLFFREAAADAAQPPMPSGSVRPPSVGSRYVVRRDARAVIEIETGVRWERLTPHSMHDVEFMELVYEPGAESHPTLYRHAGQEMVLVLTGALVIHVGFESFRLEPGDSMHLSSMVPHRYLNPTAEVTRAVTTILHDRADEFAGH
jgi:transcriptional regulator with XRE-family HTH domain